MRCPRHTVVMAAAIAAAMVGCDSTVTGNQPVGGNQASEAALQRFVRRAYLDLTGATPSDADLASRVATLAASSNPTGARRALVAELMAEPSWATVWTEELENRVLGGDTLADRYRFICSILRQQVDECRSCTSSDPCSCACQVLSAYGLERAQLEQTATDLRAGTSTSTLERRYAAAQGYFALNGGPEARAVALFDDFLGRPAEADEIDNARAMIFGGLGGGPAGLLFHRHGASYADLLDIVFDSEVYREAIVAATFERHLARPPTSAELAYFVSQLDAANPDVRPVIEAVVSSKEYSQP